MLVRRNWFFGARKSFFRPAAGLIIVSLGTWAFVQNIAPQFEMQFLADSVADISSRGNGKQSIVSIYTFQRNEGKLLYDWAVYHGNLIGFEALHIIDHISDDNCTRLYIGKMREKGANVRSYEGNFTGKQHELTKWMAASSSQFLVPLDVDEFLVLKDNDSISTKGMLDAFMCLPIDGRRYKMGNYEAAYCPEKDGDVLDNRFDTFSRVNRMTTFSRPRAQLDCMSKTFFSSKGFIRTDQGNHKGLVETDSDDAEQGYTVNGCPYYHVSNIAIAHFGYLLPWQIFYDKMKRGSEAYGHEARLDAGLPCDGDGVHYCLFMEKVLKNGENMIRREYETKLPCSGGNVFQSFLIRDSVSLQDCNSTGSGRRTRRMESD